MFAFKHFVLRLFLWKSGAAPLNYVAFVAQAKDLLFLRQVGDGYIFVNRLLRDYFVSLSESRFIYDEVCQGRDADAASSPLAQRARLRVAVAETYGMRHAMVLGPDGAGQRLVTRCGVSYSMERCDLEARSSCLISCQCIG